MQLKVLAGYRLVFPNNKAWKEFCVEFHQGVHGYWIGDNIHRTKSEEIHYAIEDVWNTMDLFIEGLRKSFPDIEYHANRCHHEMDKIIDIGFEMGNFDIDGHHEGSYETLGKSVDAIRRASKPQVAKALKRSYSIWKYCVNKSAPHVFGLIDVCESEYYSESDQESEPYSDSSNDNEKFYQQRDREQKARERERM